MKTMLLQHAVLLLLLLLMMMSTTHGQAEVMPVDFALMAMEGIVAHRDTFIDWFYGGAIALEGMFRVDRVFAIDVSLVTNPYLDKFKRDPDAYGYRILHEESIPFFRNVGDQVPLFSSVYLLRAENSSGTPNYPDSEKTEDVRIATVGAYRYVLQYPRRLAADGTPTRDYGWKTERNNSVGFLWCDDMYMGATPLVRAAVYRKDTAAIVTAARWMGTYSRYLLDPADGLYRHGADAQNAHQSCCKWGRANGWALMAKVEVLEAMEKLSELTTLPEYKEVKDLFVAHARAVKSFQDLPDGRWRQLVNDTSSFLETSGTAMFLSSLCRGVVNGWLAAGEVSECIEAAWRGLQGTLNISDGTIAGLCDGEGIETEASVYKNCSTDYLASGNGGLGTVLYAVTDYQRYLNHLAGRPLDKRTAKDKLESEAESQSSESQSSESQSSELSESSEFSDLGSESEFSDAGFSLINLLQGRTVGDIKDDDDDDDDDDYNDDVLRFEPAEM